MPGASEKFETSVRTRRPPRSKIERDTGTVRGRSNVIEARVENGLGAIGRSRRPDSGDVPAHMARLMDWFNNPTEANRLDGLVRAALAHLWLEAIHPFEDGNGRIGRALADLAMAQDLRSGQRLFSRRLFEQRA